MKRILEVISVETGVNSQAIAEFEQVALKLPG